MHQQVLLSLRSSEMTSARVFEKNFYKVASSDKVFVVDVIEDGVVYGWAFQGKGEAGEAVLQSYGIDAHECNLRFAQEIACEQDWLVAKKQIEKCYWQYLEWTKDQLLAHIKTQRKAFLQRFTDRLKPLGFRKNSNSWKRIIHEQYLFEIHVQKSGYSDQYYVNLSIKPSMENEIYRQCYYTRVMIGEDYLCDWQLTSAEAIERSLDEMMNGIVRSVLELDIGELGRQDFIQKECHCRRLHCHECWVEKNYWENLGIPEPGKTQM